MAGEAARLLGEWRAQAQAFCPARAEWSDGAGGTMASIVRAGCAMGREDDLADLMDAYVYFPGVEIRGVPEGRADHAACYSAYDAAMEDAVSNADMIQATHAAADCIEAALLARVPTLVERTVEALPELGAAETEARISSAIQGSFAAGAEMCGLLSDASESGGGSMARLYAASCRIDAALLLGPSILEN